VIPGRPKQYQPKTPETILERAKENRRQQYEAYCTEVDGLKAEFIEEFRPLYEQADEDVTPTAELFYVVDVGEPKRDGDPPTLSERDRRSLRHHE